MTESTFNFIVENLKASHERMGFARSAGIDILDFQDYNDRVIKSLFEEVFDKVKVETLYWYLYEYREGKMQIKDRDTKEILFDFDKSGDVWKYMIEK